MREALAELKDCDDPENIKTIERKFTQGTNSLVDKAWMDFAAIMAYPRSLTDGSRIITFRAKPRITLVNVMDENGTNSAMVVDIEDGFAKCMGVEGLFILKVDGRMVHNMRHEIISKRIKSTSEVEFGDKHDLEEQIASSMYKVTFAKKPFGFKVLPYGETGKGAVVVSVNSGGLGEENDVGVGDHILSMRNSSKFKETRLVHNELHGDIVQILKEAELPIEVTFKKGTSEDPTVVACQKTK